MSEGKKRLAYPVGSNEFAVYYYYELDLPAEAPQKISNVLNITDEIIRYLLVAVDPRKAKMEARRKASEESEESETTDSDPAEDNHNEEEE